MVLSLLYLFFIYPIEIFIETVFSLSMKVFSDPGIAIIFVSLCVQFLVLPLYKRADAIQESEHKKQEQMAPWVAHIKKTFSKDERFMILSEYYRQQGYEPLMSLRSSLPLLLQIPFFIAAYHFLSNLEILRGTPFLGISDLGSPDGLIRIGGLTVNLLPILMTAINIISGAVYSKGHAIKEKAQLYITAAVFLVLLYTSPSGLVFYWTLNNLFSLGKNIVMKIVHVRGSSDGTDVENDEKRDRASDLLFVLSSMALAVFSGFWIPSSAVADSPLEFSVRGHYVDPDLFVLESFVIGAGIFVFWSGLFYMMMRKKSRKGFAAVWFALLIFGLCQLFFFSKDMGNMSDIMVYDVNPVYSLWQELYDIVALAVVVFLAGLIANRYKKAAKNAALIILTGMLIMSVVNVNKTEGTLASNGYIKDDSMYTENYLKYTLSRNGKNVIVLMLDRAMSGYVPYIMEEFPELKEEFAGFTYYPNTYSYGAVTLTGGPALYGGYDFRPMDMAKDDKDLQAELDASIRFLPYNYSKAGYNCTVFDPPDYIDLSQKDMQQFFDDIPNTHAYDVGGVFKTKEEVQDDYDYLHKWSKHNYIRHSLFIMTPLALRSVIYDDGCYLSPERIDRDFTLEGEIELLDLLPQMADVSDTDDNNLFVYTNLTAHSYAELQLPDFTLSDHVDNSGYIDDWSASLHAEGATPVEDMTDKERFEGYCANAAALREVGKWMDYLRSEGVYDNTRIVLVADHGYYAFAFPQMVYEGAASFEQFNPILMVKDFDSKEFTVSQELMSNADTCELAMKDIISDPIDPYDGRIAKIEDEKSGDIVLTDYPEYDLEAMENRMYTFHDDVRDPSNWTVLFSE